MTPPMSAPTRVQLSRAKGWRMPPNTVKVDRSTRWGNPWTPGDPGTVHLRGRGGWVVHKLPMAVTLNGALDRYRRWLRGDPLTRRALGGHNERQQLAMTVARQAIQQGEER